MKGIAWLTSLTVTCCVCAALGAETESDEGPGILPAHLSESELAAPISFEVLLAIYPVDLQKRQATADTVRQLTVKESYVGILTWLKSAGFAVLKTDPNCVAIDLKGTRKQLITALHADFVRETETGRTIIVPVSGGALPYRPSGSILTIQDLITTPPAVHPEDEIEVRGDEHGYAQ